VSRFFQASRPESVSTVTLSEACSPFKPVAASPIDVYYSRVERLVVRAQQAQQSGEDDLIPLLFLRLISATESYVRDLLSRLPAICPIIWAHCSEQQMALGAAFHYAKTALAVATLEHVSFSTKGEIQKQTQKITGLHTSSDNSLRVALESFESVSELRHSVVHSYDELFYKNLREMKILDSSGARFVVSISPLLFQTFVAACHSFVRAFNRFLLDRMLDSWVVKGVLSMDWPTDKDRFQLLFESFYSKKDAVGPTNSYYAFLQTKRAASAQLAAGANGQDSPP
jgi:hypothetical protein